MSDVTIYHNPNCGTSRNTLALLREKGVEPKVVEYLKEGWTRDQLKALLAKMDNDAVRAHYERHRAEYEASGLSLLRLMRGVERSRKLGYALAGAEGVAGVGYALPLAMGADAAISIVSTASRMSAARRHEMGGIIVAMFA